MAHPNERSDERCNLEMIQLGEYDGDTVCVYYPRDATDEDLKTMWIRSPKSEITLLTDQQ
jgi:hypothetical protein